MQTGMAETIERFGKCLFFFFKLHSDTGQEDAGSEKGAKSACVDGGLGRSPGKQPCSPSPEPPPRLFIWATFLMRLMSEGSCVPQKGSETLDLSPALFCCREATAQPSFLPQLGARLPAQDGR